VSTSTDRAVNREVIDTLLREFKWATAVMDSWFAVVQSQWGAPSHSTVLDEFIDVLFPDIQREAPTLWSLVTALATGAVPKQTKEGTFKERKSDGRHGERRRAHDREKRYFLLAHGDTSNSQSARSSSVC
jgi:hypothetical protein